MLWVLVPDGSQQLDGQLDGVAVSLQPGQGSVSLETVESCFMFKRLLFCWSALVGRPRLLTWFIWVGWCG